MGIEPTTSRVYRHALWPCATTGLQHNQKYIITTLCFDIDKNLDKRGLPTEGALLLRLLLFRITSQMYRFLIFFQYQYYLQMIATKFHNSKSTGSSLLILIPFIVPKYAFLPYKRPYLFFSNCMNTFCLKPRDLNIQFKFQVDISNRS